MAKTKATSEEMNQNMSLDEKHTVSKSEEGGTEMKTLLLSLHGLMQSWGTEPANGTNIEPTKYGIVGLIAGALGRKRGEDRSDLYNLRLGVRVEQQGELLRDHYIDIDDLSGEEYREYNDYLADANFLIGLESPDEVFLEKINYALHHPKYGYYLGKNDCIIDLPFTLGIRHKDLEKALTEEPWQVSEYRQKRNGNSYVLLRLIMDTLEGKNTGIRKDVLLPDGSFGFRPVIEKNVEVENPFYIKRAS